MKNLLTLTFLLVALVTYGQEFNKQVAQAKTAYASGNLEDARFAMQQALTEIDLIVGKELIKILPAKLEALNSNPKNDNVSVSTGFAGVIVHRDYGTPQRMVNLELISNSPLITSLNALLAIPMVANAGDGSQKVIKVQGYKSILQHSVNSETNASDYTLQIPVNNTLITLNVPASNEAEVTRMANLLPLPAIAKLVQ